MRRFSKFPDERWSRQFGVPHPDKCATACSASHPVESLPDVRCPDAVCAQYRSPAGVAFSFQVSAYSIEPPFPNRAFNLFAKHNVRAALRDEIVEHGPEVAGVGGSELLASGTERLAGAASGPDGPVLRPSGELESVGPTPDPCEEVALNVTSEVRGANVRDGSLVNVACGDFSG